MRLLVARWAASLTMAAGCASPSVPLPDATVAADASCSAGASIGTLPCDVAAVLAARCQPCHQQPPLNHAPWPLLTYADTHMPFGTAGLVRWQRMAQVIEPDGSPHMPYRDAPQLSAAQLATLRGWFAACAPSAPMGTVCEVTDGGRSD